MSIHFCVEMEDSIRRAYIKQQAAKKKQEGSKLPKGMGLAIPFTKRKLLEKIDCLLKKVKG